MQVAEVLSAPKPALSGVPLRVEVKARKKFNTLHVWLTGRDFLILKADRRPPLVVLSLTRFTELVRS